MRKLLLFFACALASTAFAQQMDFSKLEIKATKVAGNVYMLETSGPGFGGGNIGVSVGDDGVVMVDDKFAELGPKIEAALKGITDKPLRFILNTHVHGDHTHGNIYFGPKSTIIAQENVRKRLPDYVEFGGQPNTPPPPQAYPVITFDHRLTIHLNGEDVRGIHMPNGHTDGDTIVFFTKSNVVHMGDDFFNGMFPFIDFENGGSVKGYIKAVEDSLTQIPADAKIIPGHGPLGTVDDLRADLKMLEETTAIVEKGIKAGKTADQMKQEKVFAAYDKYSWHFMTTDKYIDELYNGLTGKKANSGSH
jgi:glyoxylase-like metal-dependent hydrolase (beta-lactamase superfamily II)